MRVQLLGITIFMFGVILVLIADGHIGHNIGFILLGAGAVVSLVGFFRNGKSNEKNNEINNGGNDLEIKATSKKVKIGRE